MDMINIKPLSKDEWSPKSPAGVEATGVAGHLVDPTLSLASTSSEERAIRRVMGRWGAEWLS